MEGNCDTNNIDFKYRVNRKQEIMLNSSIELDEKKKKKKTERFEDHNKFRLDERKDFQHKSVL